VVAAFEQIATPIWLVLDEVHELHAANALRSLDMLLRRLPDKLRLVLSTRCEPPLALPRLRVEGRLKEIHASQLTFTRDEAALLLAGHGMVLTGPELDLLLERTEGWAAGLRLAALSLAHEPDRAARIAEFAGDERAVADYLVGEILSRQPEHIRRFLLTTSVCDQFTVDLAARLSGREDAGEILTGLERSNTLIVRLGRTRTWYRYHALLGGCLRAELHCRHASLPARLHRIASDWFAAQGATLPALEHAVAAGDTELTAGLLRRHGLSLVLGGGGAGLRRLLDRLRPDLLVRPDVALVAAAAALDAGDVPAADARLNPMNLSVSGQPTERLRALHAAVALHRARLHGDLPAALETLKAVHGTHTGDPDVDLLALLNRGISHIWLGDPGTAEVELQDALTLSTAAGRDNVTLQCLGNLGAVSASTSAIVEMTDRARAALDFAAKRGWAHISHCAFACVLAGWGAFQRLDDAAGGYARRAVDLLRGQTDATIELSALSLAAIVAFDSSNDRHATVASLRAVWQRLGGELMAPALIGYEAPFEQRMALRVGELGWAEDVPERVRTLVGAEGEYHYLRAVLLAHRGRPGPARRMLCPVIGEMTRCLVDTTLVDAWLLEAVLADGTDDRRRGHEALVAALDVAEPMRALRPFVEGGQPVRDLLARGSGRFGRHEEFAGRILAAVPAGRPGPTDSLTPRELETLAELPSMRTTEEIAEALHCSANTVKTHLRGVYRKLGVRNRRDAVTAARHHGLL
ncbi:MAG TPA: LuxR C-terminal-related transcriptional regulator, partial [Mycobacteriales bacterium]|nr:LuxR C-terminal-related transcriptional regulator [Mycobacteriales bacterium]